MNLSDYHRLHRQEKQAWDLPGLEKVALAQDNTFLDRLEDFLSTPDERFAGDLVTIDRGPFFKKPPGFANCISNRLPISGPTSVRESTGSSVGSSEVSG